MRLYARRLAAEIAGLVRSRFDPWQRSVILIHTVEVDQGLAAHLGRPDPLVGDQFISLGLSKFAIAATVLARRSSILHSNALAGGLALILTV